MAPLIHAWCVDRLSTASRHLIRKRGSFYSSDIETQPPRHGVLRHGRGVPPYPEEWLVVPLVERLVAPHVEQLAAPPAHCISGPVTSLMRARRSKSLLSLDQTFNPSVAPCCTLCSQWRNDRRGPDRRGPADQRYMAVPGCPFFPVQAKVLHKVSGPSESDVSPKVVQQHSGVDAKMWRGKAGLKKGEARRGEPPGERREKKGFSYGVRVGTSPAVCGLVYR